MSSMFRKSLIVVTGLAAFVGAAAHAQNLGKAIERVRGDDQEARQSREVRQVKQPPQAAQPAPPRQNSRSDRAPQVVQSPPRDRSGGGSRFSNGNGNANRDGNRDGNRNNAGSGDNGSLGGALARNYRSGDQGRSDNRGDYRGDRGNHNGSRYRGGNYHPPRVVSSLPYGYRHYNWNGRPYYQHRGSWYRPYGGSYLSIGVPYGLFVTGLGSLHTSFWYGGSRYYYADDTYYLYEPTRRGYVVTRSPYDDDRDDEYRDDGAFDEDLYIYPARGQSEQQQADDRYECHRWAVDETNYDPIDDEYQADERADYLRAMTACLTGRGYSVR